MRHHGLEPRNDVVVRFTTRIPEAKLVPLSIGNDIWCSFRDLLLCETIILASIHLVHVPELPPSHLIVWLAVSHQACWKDGVLDKLRRLDGAAQGRRPKPPRHSSGPGCGPANENQCHHLGPFELPQEILHGAGSVLEVRGPADLHPLELHEPSHDAATCISKIRPVSGGDDVPLELDDPVLELRNIFGRQGDAYQVVRMPTDHILDKFGCSPRKLLTPA
mmetsp:Transcript_54684/g.128431  ORF Transcript_54684/g.128431 Transcript_54684/m.128431 type:complete len:220 (+) Transcript_54684:319-978(+)